MIVAFTIFTGITVYLVYYNWSLINNIYCIKFDNCKKNKNCVQLYKMDTAKPINIKNQPYYYKKSYKDINIYNIGYVTKKKIGNCMNINSVNPLYLGITRANGYIEEKDANNYSVFDSTDENKELLKKYNVFNGIRDKIREINNNECDYEKGYMKIKFSSDDEKY